MCGRYLSHGGITVYIPSLLFFVPSQLVSSLAQIATTDREFGIPTTYRQRANIKFLEYAKPIVEQFFVYYALLAKEMPHWEKWKNKLEKIMM